MINDHMSSKEKLITWMIIWPQKKSLIKSKHCGVSLITWLIIILIKLMIKSEWCYTTDQTADHNSHCNIEKSTHHLISLIISRCARLVDQKMISGRILAHEPHHGS